MWTFRPSRRCRVFLLGVVAASVLGIALSALSRKAKSASAVFNLPFLALMFISGVFVEFSSIPPWLRTVAGSFPCDGWRPVCARCSSPTTSNKHFERRRGRFERSLAACLPGDQGCRKGMRSAAATGMTLIR